MAIETARGRTFVSSVKPASAFWKQSRRVLGKDWQVAYVFIAPLVILLFGLIAYPLVRALILSFYNYTGITNRGYVGFQNYERLWENNQFRDSVVTTVKYATIAVFFKFWLGLLPRSLLH